MVHSTGANNPNLKRYIGPDDGLLGKNQYNNHWNQDKPDGRQICVHAFIGKLADGSIATYQTLPWNHRGWHAGGKANDTHIGFEIREDNLSDSSYFSAVYKEATELCAYLCKLYGLTENDIIGHYEGFQKKIASNHGDPRHWFSRHGKSMDTFRADVKKLLTVPSPSTPPPQKLYRVQVGAYSVKSNADAMLAKDTSKKIRSVFKAKGESGKPLCTNPPYGYIKDPEDKTHWIIDEEAAKVVKEAFHLCMQGYGPTQIAKEFSKKKIMNPTAHAKASGINIPDNRGHDDDYIWRGSTIVHMLSKQEYLGHTVNFKTYRKSYKQKKQMKNDPSEWMIFENTHEAIIEESVFEVVQKIRDGRRRLTPMGEMPMLSGMLFCADCGNKLYQVRHRGWEHDKEHFVCATYRKIKGGCSSHQIRNVVVEELLLDGIHKVTCFAREYEDEFVELVTKKTRTALDKSMRDGKRELEHSQARINKLDDIIQRLYEDNIEGKISDERFAKMTANYEAEQHTLESRVAELKSTMTSEKESALGVEHFLALVRKYTDMNELTAEIIREFVEKIYVYKAERIDGRRVQRIKIVYNCIGEFDPPVSTSTTEKEKSA